MLTAEVFVVVFLAAYRAARIVAADSISLAFRDRLYSWAWDDEHPVEIPATKDQPARWEASSRGPIRSYVHTLFTCALCLGVWFSAAFYVAWRWWDWMPVRAFLVILALAGAQCALQYFTEAADD